MMDGKSSLELVGGEGEDVSKQTLIEEAGDNSPTFSSSFSQVGSFLITWIVTKPHNLGIGPALFSI